jgi:hypothetical protein
MIAVGLILATGLVAGCADGTFHPWGEPVPTTTPQPDPTCAVREVPVPPTDPLSMRRPAEVLPGWAWAIVAPQVRALKANDTKADYCVPFALHVYATMEGVPAVPMIDPAGKQVFLPYDGVKVTPWFGAYMLFSYDPTSPRWQSRPPTYEVSVRATYLIDRDLLGVGDLAAFRCALKINGATVVQDLKQLGQNTLAVGCTLKEARYNP